MTITKLGIGREQAREIRALIKAGLTAMECDQLYEVPVGVSQNIGSGLLFDDVKGEPKRGMPRVRRQRQVGHHGRRYTNITHLVSIEWTGVDEDEDALSAS